MNGLKFDYEQMGSRKSTLETDLNNLVYLFDYINLANDAIVADWESDSKNHYYDALNDVMENYLRFNDLSTNITGYLTSVYNNYASMEKSASSAFSSSFSGFRGGM